MRLLKYITFFSIIFAIRCELKLSDYKIPIDDITNPTNDATPGVERWYIRESDGICTKFIFKTHALNLNVFNNREECLQHMEFTAEEKFASCDQPNEAAIVATKKQACKGLKTFRYTFVPATAQNPATCKRFIYYGCGGNANNFKNSEECMDYCLPGENPYGNKADCHFTPTLPKGSENMVNAIIADHHHKQCVHAGISNAQTRGKFSSLSHCRKTCFPKADDENPRCLYSPKQGLCIGATQNKYYFDRETSKCLPYITKDCVYEDMINSFDTYDDCIGSCPAVEYRLDTPQGWPDASDMCKQNKNFGVGIMDITAFYFNSETNECLPFVYTGLKGNDNRFETLELCMGACSGKPLHKVYHSDQQVLWIDPNDDDDDPTHDTNFKDDYHLLPNIIPEPN